MGSLTYEINGRLYTFYDIFKDGDGYVQGVNKKHKRHAYLWKEYIQEDGFDPVAAKLVKGDFDIFE